MTDADTLKPSPWLRDLKAGLVVRAYLRDRRGRSPARASGPRRRPSPTGATLHTHLRESFAPFL
jgi:hypothetical protein